MCLAYGAYDYKSIAYSIDEDCKTIACIVDWFHIAMKFQNISIPEIGKEILQSVKWNLWHCNCDKAFLVKLNKLLAYISNNKDGIVNYEERKSKGLVFTSNVAESDVKTLINKGQKGKQRMLWSSKGAHNVLQIKALNLGNHGVKIGKV